MLKSVELRSMVFHGSPDEVQEQLYSFLSSKVIKIHGMTQSQSSLGDKVVVTTTLLYAEYQKEQKEVLGFNTPR